MALFDDASLVVTPNGYQAGTLYSIKPTSGAGDMTVVRATTATRVNSAGLIESVANNVPRLDYLNASCPSLLVEPQRTNVLTYSEQFATSWINNGATIISNDTTAPDGNLTADRLTATGGGFGVVKFSTWTATNKVASCFVKANTSNLFRIANVSGGGGSVTFNLSTQAITATTGFTGSIESLPDGWFRCIAIDTLARSGTFSIGVTAIGESVFVWGSQLEAGSYPTSYIPTVASAVTRNADQVYKQGISSLIGQTEGTIFIDFDIDNILSQTIGPVIFSFSSTNYIRLFTTGAIYYVESNTVSLVSPVGTINNGQNKIAVNYKNNDFSIYANGVLVGSNNSGAVVAKSQIGLYYLASTIYNPSLFYNLVALFPNKLTGAECISLTTI